MNRSSFLSRRSFARRLLDAVLYVSLFSSLGVALTACPAGTKTSLEAGVTVKIDPDHCKEDRAFTSPTPDLALLDCTTVDGTASIQVSFPRKEWQAMRARDAGAGVEGRDAGPGK